MTADGLQELCFRLSFLFCRVRPRRTPPEAPKSSSSMCWHLRLVCYRNPTDLFRIGVRRRRGRCLSCLPSTTPISPRVRTSSCPCPRLFPPTPCGAGLTRSPLPLHDRPQIAEGSWRRRYSAGALFLTGRAVSICISPFPCHATHGSAGWRTALLCAGTRTRPRSRAARAAAAGGSRA